MKPMELEGIGTIYFPDGASQDQIIQFLNSQSKQQLQQIADSQKPDSLGRQLGLTGRAAAKSVMSGMGVGSMVLDPFLNLAGQQTTSAAQEQLLDRLGFPTPRNPTERVVQDVSSALAGTTGLSRAAAAAAPKIASPVGQYVAEQFATNPQAQAAVTAASSGAASSAREQGADPLSQMGIGMLAGTLAPGGGSLPTTQRLAGAPRELVSPFSQAGRQAIAGQVLNRLAYDPRQAMINLEQEAQATVPGVQRTMAAAARDPGLAGAETALRGLDTSNAMAARISANQQALMDEFRKLSGSSTGMLDLADKLRTRFTAPRREAAFSNDKFSPDMFDALKTYMVDDTARMIQRSPAGVRQDVETAMNWALKRLEKADSPKALYEVRKDLAAAALGKYNKDVPSLQLARGQLVEVINSVDNLLTQNNPAYAQYMQKFRAWSAPMDRMKLLQDIEGRVTTGQPNVMTGEPVLQAGKLRSELAKGADAIETKISPAIQQRLENIMTEINRGQAATAPGVKVPGSDTFRNLSVGNLIGRVLSQNMADNKTLRTMARPLDWLYKMPDEAIQQLLIDAMNDPALAANMMRQANMMTIDTVAKSLQTKAQRLGFGGAMGIGEGAQ